jgi:hypothetical protein
VGPSRRAQQEPTAGRSLRVWPLLIVVIGVVCGLIIAMLGETTWRLGALVIGASLGVGAVERIALPGGEAGLLHVVVLTVMAATIIALAIVVPPGR